MSRVRQPVPIENKSKKVSSSADSKINNNKSATEGDLFKLIYENLPAGILMLDEGGKILRFNKSFQKLLDYSKADLKNTAFKDILFKNEAVKYTGALTGILEGKYESLNIQLKCHSKDNREIDLTCRLALLDEGGRKKKKIILLCGDASEINDINEKLQDEIHLFNTFLKNTQDYVYFKDLESRFVKVSESMGEKLGVAAPRIIGKTDFDFFGEEHAKDAFEDEKNIIKTRVPIIEKEEEENWKDGRINWVSTSKMPFYDRKGRVAGTFGISRNITRRKKIDLTHNALLRISEAVFTASDMRSMFVTIHEVLGTLMPVKNLFIALYDEKEDMLTFPYYIDEYDEPREASKPRKGLTEYILRTGRAQLIDEEMDYALREMGEVEIIGTPAKIWLGVPLKIADKTIGVIVVQDYDNPKAYQEPEMQLISFIAENIALVIERKRNVVEIERYTEELKQLNATKDKFFSIIAHDLKNPFITILGFSELLLADYYDLTDDEKLYYIQEMKKSSENSHILLQNLLQWSRSQTGFIEFHPQNVNLANIIIQNIELLKATAEKKDIALLYSMDSNISVYADIDMINTVIRNLISNAVKFTPRHGRISISALRAGNMINIAVEDSGVGMDSEAIARLFKLDAGRSTEGTERETGSGLGLILCKEFVKKNGGDIWVESRINEGSKFTFSVPAY